MTLNEVKLTLAIEDPQAREQRQYMDIEVCIASFAIQFSWVA